MKERNTHPVHDLSVLLKVSPHDYSESQLRDGPINGDLTDTIMDNPEVIRKSMEITGVGQLIRNVLETL